MRRCRMLLQAAFLLLSLLMLTACPGPATEQPVAVVTAEPEPTQDEQSGPLYQSTPTPEPTVEPSPTEATSSLEQAQAATVQVLVTGSQFLEQVGFTGSGVIYDPSGLVITNNHVVEGAAIVKVKLEGEDRELSARVLGKSPCDDLAVLQLTGSDFPVATIGGDIAVGDDVFAIGYPLGDATQSLTKGVVSKVGIAVPTGFADYLEAIQTDVAINPGSSGGPLVTANGEVVGINSAGLDDAQGTNFAISMDYAQPVIERLAAGENINWIGVNAAPITADLAAEFGIGLEPGLFVYAVDSGSPADEIGIQEGDFITSIEGVSVGADGTVKDYCDVLRSHDNDDVLDVSVIREGARLAGQFNGRELEGGETVAVETDTVEETNPEEAPVELNYVDVTDETGRITLQLPDIWAASPGEKVIHAAENIDAWFESYGGTSEGAATVPGFYIEARDQEGAVDLAAVEEFLDNLGIPENCTFDAEARAEYDDGVYQGLYDVMSCEPGAYVSLIAYDPNNPSFLIWIESYGLTDADFDILGTALDTFYVAPADGASANAGDETATDDTSQEDALLAAAIEGFRALAEEIAAKAGPLPPGTPYSSYTTVSDATGNLSISVPVEWSDVRGSNFVYNGENVGSALLAARNADNFFSTGTESGVYWAESTILAERGVSPEEVVQIDFSAFCTPLDVTSFEGPAYEGTPIYRGAYQLWVNCGTGEAFLVVALIPFDNSSVSFMQTRLVTQADIAALEPLFLGE